MAAPTPSRARRRATAALTLALALAGCGSDSGSPNGTGTDDDAAARPRRVGAIAAAARPRPPVYFIGLDGADWALLDRLMAEGRMPALQGLVRDSRRGVLTTEHPALSPLVWTTMMTGVGPREHGVLDFVRFRPGSGEREPIGSEERARPAIWNMATWGGKRVGLFGLWATYPAETVDGVLVSDRLFGFLNLEHEPPAGAVYPSTRQAWATAALAQAEAEVDLAEIQRFLPSATAAELAAGAESTRPYDDPVTALRRILVETRVYDSLFRSFVDESHPDLAIAYLQGSDSIGHLFARYAAPKLPQVAERDFERYHEVPARYFEWLDGLLAHYRQMAERDGAVLFLASDHGFLWSEGRPDELSSSDVSTAAKWHRSEGIYLLWGLDGTETIDATADAELRGGVRQVCATLLALLGLPPGQGIAGPPLPPVAAAQADSPAATDYAAVFTELRARATRNATAAERDETARADAGEALAKLRALGYLDGAEADRAPPAALAEGSTRTAASYNNEGLILEAEGRKDEARAAFERALELNPDLASALWNLSDLELGAERWDRADELLISAARNDLPEAKTYLIGRAIRYQRDGKLARAQALIERAAEVVPDEDEYWLFLGRYRVERRDCAGALEAFAQAAALAPQNPAVYSAAGVAHLCRGESDLATAAFRRSLQLDPDQPKVEQFLRQLGAAAP